MSASNPRKSPGSSSSPPSHAQSQSEYAFPRYDPPSRNSSTTRYNSRRLSTASSVTSIGGALDSSSGPWSETMREAGQNAISTLLQPPIVRTGLIAHTSAPASSAHKPPTARDIPPVTLTNIPHVDPAEFKTYLAQISALSDSLQRAKDSEDEEGLRIIRRGSNKSDEFADLLEANNKGRPDISRQSSLASLSSLTPNDAPSPRRRSSAGPGKRAAQGPAPLATIPTVYFDDDFRLENPRIFDVVSERSEVVRPAPGAPEDPKQSNGNAAGPRKALATNAILQEKLSWYMDTIEVHLISAISTASYSFFAALGSLRELHSEAADSVARIKQLRDELDELDKEMALGGMEIVKQRRRRENLKQLADAVQQLKSVVAGLGLCESYVESEEVERALDAIDALERLIHGEQLHGDAKVLDVPLQDQLRDLSGATALQGVDNDLTVLRFRIGKTFESRFIKSMLGDIIQHIESTPVNDTLQRWSNASQRTRGGHNREKSAFPSYLTTNNEFRADLLSNINGLYRANHTSSATTAYRDAVLHEIKSIIKRPLPSSNDDDTDSVMSMSTVGGNKPRSQQDRSAILARNLRNLDPESAEETLVKIYIGVGETLRRVGTQVKVLLDVTSTLDGSSPGSPPPGSPSIGGPRSPPRTPNLGSIEDRVSGGKASEERRHIQEELHQALDMSNLLGQAVDIAQTQIVKVLRVRTEQSVRQQPTRFLRYFTLNLLFANECEAVSGRSGTVLKNVVNSQIKEFIQLLSNSQQQALAQGMDADLWAAKDFTESDDVYLERILEGSDRDPAAWSIGSKVWLPYDETNDSALPNGGPTSANPPQITSAREKTRPATIEEETFILPASAIICLRGLSPYLELITGIPSLTADVSPHLLAYIQLFNSRCTQLILGAGATKIVGLKNITTKHLALASRALGFIATLIPHLREFVRRHLGAGASAAGLMGEFDKVRRVLQEHQASISEKLVEIMAGRATLHLRAMRAIVWDDDSAGERAVSAYMDTLTKETGTLHRVLSKHMPEGTVLGIMEPVFGSYRDQLGKAFREAPVTTEKGKERMLRDAQHFAARISKLDGAGDLGDSILTTATNRTLPIAEVPAAATTAASTETATATTPEPPLPPTPVVEISGTPPNPPLPVSPDEVVGVLVSGDAVEANGVVEAETLVIASPGADSEEATEVEVETEEGTKDEKEVEGKEAEKA
ncbi:hypothetical protein VE03_03036 [Pseudogymnoascus sp. 23342-1-I1]|nr:hypothetical protein VE03_03036 [Pseudogymnoascus sp. 23342-1-I1]